MATSTSSSRIFSNISSTETKPRRECLWPEKYIIDNLPPWIYSDNKPPASKAECAAKISSIEYTIADIDIQMDIRQSEMSIGKSRYDNTYDFEKWRLGALKAKQSQYYLLNAYRYWQVLNDDQYNEEDTKLNKLIKLLIEDPKDFVQLAERLLD
jgi:hypothetical protein|tara:strand:- start:201 stop:662 length:462 start_codon:yes stop_codon:yes gene_type:complete